MPISAKGDDETSSPIDYASMLGGELEVLKSINEILPKAAKEAAESQIKAAIEEFQSKATDEDRAELAKLGELFRDPGRMKTGEILVVKNENAVEFLTKSLSLFVLGGRAGGFIREMSLVFLTAKFEDFFGQAIWWAVRKKPEILMTKQKTFTYEEILRYPDKERLLDAMVSRELDRVVDEGIDGVQDYLLMKFGLDITQVRGWAEFREVLYRRNLVVHNNCMPNDTYRLKTGYNGPDQRLEITQEYVSEAIDLTNTFARAISEAVDKKFTASS